MIRLGFDIGGVLSKYPEIFRPLVQALLVSPGIEVHVLSDMQPHAKCVSFLHDNGFLVPPERVHACDYGMHGEMCKAEKLKELGIDLMIDDHPGYLTEGAPVRLLVMPDPQRPYLSDDWVTDGSEGTFGRRKKE